MNFLLSFLSNSYISFSSLHHFSFYSSSHTPLFVLIIHDIIYSFFTILLSFLLVAQLRIVQTVCFVLLIPHLYFRRFNRYRCKNLLWYENNYFSLVLLVSIETYTCETNFACIGNGSNYILIICITFHFYKQRLAVGSFKFHFMFEYYFFSKAPILFYYISVV